MAVTYQRPKKFLARLRAAVATNPLRGKTPDQVEAYIESNVTDLASAKDTLKTMGRVLALHDALITELLKREFGEE